MYFKYMSELFINSVYNLILSFYYTSEKSYTRWLRLVPYLNVNRSSSFEYILSEVASSAIAASRDLLLVLSELAYIVILHLHIKPFVIGLVY